MQAHKLKQVVVVLVDDEAGVRSAMQMLLEAFGFIVESYASADEALSSKYCQNGANEQYPPAIIVSDVRMPGLDGFQFLSKIRKGGITIPFVLVSGHATKDELSHGLALGAQGFLTKPYDPNDLRTMLEELTEARPRGQAQAG